MYSRRNDVLSLLLIGPQTQHINHSYTRVLNFSRTFWSVASLILKLVLE